MGLCTLTLLDLLTTLYALSLGAVEINPLIRSIIDISPRLFVLVKLSILPLCWWLRDKQSYPWVCGAYGVVVLNNFLIISLLR